MPAWRNTRTAPLTTTQRGYGTAHQKARATAAEQHHPTDPCCRCGHPLGPMSRYLHYDHDPTDPTRQRYLGFAHAKCNEVAAAQAGGIAVQYGTPQRTLRW